MGTFLHRIIAAVVCTSCLATAGVASAATVFINTPDLCTKVQSVGQGRVYLTTDKKCPQIAGKVPVELPQGTDVEVYVNGVAWGSQRPAEFDSGSPAEALKRAQDLAGTIDVPKNVNEKEGFAAAKEVADYSISDEFVKKLDLESARIRTQDILGEEQVIEDHYADLKKISKGSVLSSSERVYIFASSSMPLATVRNYAAAIDAIGDPNIIMVFRGMINGMTDVRPTKQYFGSVLKRDPTCTEMCSIFLGQVQIDPYLFKRYGVTEVPAVVYVKGVEKENDEVSEGQEDVTSAGQSFTFLGDAPFGYAMNEIAQASVSTSAKAIAKKMGN